MSDSMYAYINTLFYILFLLLVSNISCAMKNSLLREMCFVEAVVRYNNLVIYLKMVQIE